MERRRSVLADLPTFLPFPLALVLVLPWLAGCDPAMPSDDRPGVVVSVLPQQYAVERLAGDLVAVSVMIPPGASPSQYEPTLPQMKRLQAARLYVAVGHPSFPFEQAWLARMLGELPDLRVVDGSSGIETREGDPHYWLAPRQMERMAETIARALETLLPERRDELHRNLADFRAEIDALDVEIRARLDARPARRPAFMVFHPAWGYFAQAYGLEQLAIEDEHKQPDAHALAERMARARALGIEVVFVQPQFDRAAAETVATEIGARVAVLDPLALDWDANLREATRAIAESLPR